MTVMMGVGGSLLKTTRTINNDGKAREFVRL
jgi:hypothetical protein